MAVKVAFSQTSNNLKTIVMENRRIRAILMPELGAKLWQLHHKPTETDFLWHNPQLEPQLVGPDSVYDDVFFGGWDELYPNDEAEVIGGKLFPDHGEIWLLPWKHEIVKSDSEEAVLHLWVDTVTSQSRVEKWITLRADEAKLRFTHKITNLGTQPQPFLWKLHAAMRVDEHSRIDLPAESVYIEDFGDPRTGRTKMQYEWPMADGHDMRKVPDAASGISEFQYATKMKNGWCALTHTKEKLSFGLSYDREVLPSCWLFASYGGWQDINAVVLEPCTGFPVSVPEGIKNKTHQTLMPGQALQCNIVASVREGLTKVEHIDTDGEMT